MKKGFSVLFALIMAFSLSVNVFALGEGAEQQPSIEVSADDTEIWRPLTRWSTINYISMGISSSGNNVCASYDVQGYNSNYTVRVTAKVQKYAGNWQTVKSSTKSGKYYCMADVYATISAGTMARMVLDVTVLDASGKTVETLTVTSKIKTI